MQDSRFHTLETKKHFRRKPIKMDNSHLDEILQNNVCECHVKMELINDYLNRFKISDNRLTAPIHDIERCIDTMIHIIQHMGVGPSPNDDSHSGDDES